MNRHIHYNSELPANSEHRRDWDRTSDLPRVKRGEVLVMWHQGLSSAPIFAAFAEISGVRASDEANVTCDRRLT